MHFADTALRRFSLQMLSCIFSGFHICSCQSHRHRTALSSPANSRLRKRDHACGNNDRQADRFGLLLIACKDCIGNVRICEGVDA